MSNIHDTTFSTPDKDIIVLSVDIAIKNSFGCGVFTSCTKNSFFRQMDATKNMIGFLNFFGTSGIYQVNPENPDDNSTHIANNYKLTPDENPNSFSGPIVNCQQEYEEGATTDAYGYPVEPSFPCGCSSCKESCTPIDWSKILKEQNILNGFNYKTLYLAGFLLLLVLLSRFWNCYRKRQKRLKRASMDSYDRIKNIIEKQEH